MKKYLFLMLITSISILVNAQNMTDISLFWKDSVKQESAIESNTGNLYKMLGHHGPAIENEWIGLRLYFDYKVAIDVYNKTKPGLELEKAKWYPSIEEQKNGWGADQYKVGKTVGMGGIRLWDGEKEVFLDPVSKRTAKVRKEPGTSIMEMLSEGIPYKGDTIDVLIRVTVFSGVRKAKVEAFAFSSKPVQFLTGINYFPTLEIQEGVDYIATWGVHPEDVAAFQLNIGGSIKYNPTDFERKEKTDNQFQLISKPTKYLQTWVASSCEKEAELNTADSFFEYVENLK